MTSPDLAADSQSDADRDFVLQKVQPGLLGLMDGAVSTLAPLFTAAEMTGKPSSAFLVGLAASLGAGISMGLAEALSDPTALIRASRTVSGLAGEGDNHEAAFLSKQRERQPGTPVPKLPETLSSAVQARGLDSSYDRTMTGEAAIVVSV